MKKRRIWIRRKDGIRQRYWVGKKPRHYSYTLTRRSPPGRKTQLYLLKESLEEDLTIPDLPEERKRELQSRLEHVDYQFKHMKGALQKGVGVLPPRQTKKEKAKRTKEKFSAQKGLKIIEEKALKDALEKQKQMGVRVSLRDLQRYKRLNLGSFVPEDRFETARRQFMKRLFKEPEPFRKKTLVNVVGLAEDEQRRKKEMHGRFAKITKEDVDRAIYELEKRDKKKK